MARGSIRRDDIIDQFKPLVPVLEEVIESARLNSSVESLEELHPAIARAAHLRRVSGTMRWILIADGLVARAGSLPQGYRVLSQESDHNAGRYVFGWPGGVLTVRRQPHDEDEGLYVQERLEEVLAATDLAPGLDLGADAIAYLSVPSSRPARLIVTHETLSEPMIIALDEIGRHTSVVSPLPASPVPTARVSSTLVREDYREFVPNDRL